MPQWSSTHQQSRVCDVTVWSRFIFTGADGRRGGKMSGRTCCEVDQRHVSQSEGSIFCVWAGCWTRQCCELREGLITPTPPPPQTATPQQAQTHCCYSGPLAPTADPSSGVRTLIAVCSNNTTQSGWNIIEPLEGNSVTFRWSQNILNFLCE